tara:strand:+ start:1531 stop:2790 length:1260 start_codon:yes stop_codon:yes gene_type:complete
MKNFNIAIIGQGYVGLPLAIEFGKKYKTIGFDINKARIKELKKNSDSTKEVSSSEFKLSKNISFSSNIKDIINCNIYIVTVPTPIDEFNKPDLNPLKSASETIGNILKNDDIVIYESTVFPGCTEEVCVPILEKFSNLKFNNNFFVGYSPERIVPGDKINTITKIVKVTSGSNKKIADIIDNLYSSIITAGTFKAPNIKTAEASKAIENAQRDINISFVNELALIFDKIGIDTNDVLDAAATKWNFLKYQPGLVGGHCISVDPHYLSYKAQKLGYIPQVILSGRRVNDDMSNFVASKMIKVLLERKINPKKCKILILGITFKENCPDIRNTKIIDVYNELKSYGSKVEIYDYEADSKEVYDNYNIKLLSNINDKYDGIILAVSHKKFINIDLNSIKMDNKSVIFDLKSFYDRELVDYRL